jgi:outer membrane protein assembly factor BamB
MMFRKLRTIEMVYMYSFVETELLCSFKKEDKSGMLTKININNGSIAKKVETKTAQDTFMPCNGKLLTKDNRNTGLILNDSFEVIEEISDSLKLADNHMVSDYITIYRGKLKNKEFGVHSLSEKKLLWISGDQKALEIFGNKLFGQSNYLLYRTGIKDGNILWEQDFKSVYPELSENKGRLVLLDIHNSILIVGIEKLNKLLALDIETGVIKWEIDTFVKGLLMDKEKGLLYQMMVNYAAFDLDTGELKENYRDNAYFESVGIESQRSNYVLVGDHIITTDWQKGIIGAFNTVTHEFDWVHKEEGVNFPSPNPILYNEPYLLVHDNKGTLHIFEKE